MERIDMHTTASNNTSEFLKKYTEHRSTKDFLEGEDYIPLHSSNLDALEEEVLMEKDYDIDGLVLELKSLESVTLPVRRLHLDVLRNNLNIYHKLKKHIVMHQYSPMWREALKSCQGIVISRVNGFELVIALLPPNVVKRKQLDCIKTRAIHLEYFKQVKSNAEALLKQTTTEEKSRPTLRKNNLGDLSFWDTLPSDQEFVLSIIDKAINITVPPAAMLSSIFCWQFGQKDGSAFHLNEIVKDRFALKRLSIHNAVSLSLPLSGCHVMFAREGLGELLGDRGTLYPVLTFSEAANYQTNLDGNELDVSNRLRNVASFPRHVSFIQLYADLPHRRSGVKPHRVSGSIVSTGLLHHNTTVSLYRDAASYLGTMRDNATKLVGLTKGRIEIVTAMDSVDLPFDQFTAKHFFNDHHLSQLFLMHPILLPFVEEIPSFPDLKFINIIQNIVTYIIDELDNLFKNNKGKGGFTATWYAYQLELSLDKMMYGNLICQEDHVLARNLGPGSSFAKDQRSSTFSRGFLSLQNHNACAINHQCPPPLNILTKSPIEQKRIKMAFHFADNLDASNGVIGVALLQSVIFDLEKHKGSPYLICSLKSSVCPIWGKIVGPIGVEQLADDLASRIVHLVYPCVSQHLCKMVRAKGLNLILVFKCGLTQSGLVYFPHTRSYDSDQKRKLSWNQRDLLKIVAKGSKDKECRTAEMSQLAVTYLESNDLAYSSTLRPLREANELPWIEETLVKIDGQGLSDEQQVKVCAYVTAIGMLTNNIFVAYKKLLVLKLEVSHFIEMLEKVQVLSLFKFSTLAGVSRLHPSISFKLAKPSVVALATTSKRPHQNETIVQVEEIVSEEEEEEIQILNSIPCKHIPSSSRITWSKVEEKILSELQPKLTLAEKYREYITACLKKDIPHRSYKSVQRKLKRL